MADTTGAGGAAIEPFRSTTTTLMRRSKGWLALGASPWLVSFLLVLAAALTHKYALLVGLIHTGIFGAIGLAFAYKFNRNPTFEPGEVTADGTGVRFRGDILASRDEIKEGFVMPYKERTVVRLTRHGASTSIYVGVADVDEGRRLLRALGLDATQTVAKIRALSRVFTMSAAAQLGIFMAPTALLFASIMGSVAVQGKHAFPLGIALLPFAYAFMLTMAMTRTKVQIGADGILTRWFGKQRFFPYAEITWVNPYEASTLNKRYVGVELVLQSGESVKLLTGQKRWGDEEQGLIIERIREAIEAFKSGTAGADASILGRNGRAPRDWVSALRGIGAGANADMRTASIPLERLWRIVEDASAAPLARFCAAIALAPQVPPAERKRIRVAAATTASPKLRVALEHASSSEASDEALAEELARIEAEHGDPHGKQHMEARA